MTSTFVALVLLGGFAAHATADDLLLNGASLDELAALDHVDADDAAAIVALREQRGRLGSIEELRVIRSLDGSALDSLRRSLSVDMAVPVGAVKRYDDAGQVLAEFDGEPTIQQVQAWATDYAHMSPDLVRKWFRASKSFAALPQLTLEYRFADGWDQDFFYTTREGDALTTPDERSFAILDDAGRDQDMKYLVRARWDLDQLVMSSERIRVINEAQDVAKLRDKVLAEVTRLYFERRRVQVEILLSPKADTLGQVKDQLRLSELTANIDALTGGQFTAALARAGARSAASRRKEPGG